MARNIARDEREAERRKKQLREAGLDLFSRHGIEAAKSGGSIRTNLPEQELFKTLTLTILGMAERYAQGLVWANNRTGSYLKELSHLKEMLLAWIRNTSGRKTV